MKSSEIDFEEMLMLRIQTRIGVKPMQELLELFQWVDLISDL